MFVFAVRHNAVGFVVVERPTDIIRFVVLLLLNVLWSRFSGPLTTLHMTNKCKSGHARYYHFSRYYPLFRRLVYFLTA